MEALDAHAKAPDALRQTFKKYLKKPRADLDTDEDIIDLRHQSIKDDSFTWFFLDMNSSLDLQNYPVELAPLCGAVFESKKIPGTEALLRAVRWLLERLLHRDLADERHRTNLHKHYHFTYDHATTEAPARIDSKSAHEVQARSFFYNGPTSQAAFQPIDPSVHKPMLVAQALKRKLRWITLGGQYDWTEKVYPDGPRPDFPKDVATLVRHAFPGTKPEAAIVNIYSPGDTLSLHRDVSEESAEGLVSISIGCDALFIIGIMNDHEELRHLTIRLRSGDALLMSDKARHAWHGVPRVLDNTCPDDIAAWPDDPETCEAGSNTFSHWRNWMSDKRINLNIRQMQNHSAAA